MQKIMQRDAAVFRTGETLQEGVDALAKTFASFADVQVADRCLIWNTDLVETIELDNLLLQATATIVSRGEPQGKPRRACARGLPGARRRELAEAHAVLGGRRRQDAHRLPPGAPEHADDGRRADSAEGEDVLMSPLMAEFTLPANSKIDKAAGTTHKAPAGAKRVRTFVIYRFDPDSRREPAHGHLRTGHGRAAARWFSTR